MNHNAIFSIPASVTTLVPFRRVKMTATGAAYCAATEHCIGTLLPGDPGDTLQAAVQGAEHGLHFATVGNTTPVLVGDRLAGFADGKVIKWTTGTVVAFALEAAGGLDDVIRVRNVPYVGV
jgi:hypothetical protein